jgi:hypothetical protein
MRLLIVVFTAVFALVFAVSRVRAGESATPAERPDDYHLQLKLDPAEQGGEASASVRIHATRDVIWQVLTSCAQAVQIVPGLKSCDVLETAPDQSWQRIHQVMDYSWYIPRVSYEVKANYTKPSGIVFEKVAGDLMRLKGSWVLRSDGDFTVAQYDLDFVPGFWVPRWFVRSALKRDLPKMLHALRDHAEAAQSANGG